MSTICVSTFCLSISCRYSLLPGFVLAINRSIYQEIPLYTLDEYKELAPEEARTDEILADEHQLMISRLNFELAERQRQVFIQPGHFRVNLTVNLLDLIAGESNSCNKRRTC